MKYFILCFLMLVVVNCSASPMITLDGKKITDFGTFPSNKKQSAIFVIKNTGDKDLRITKIRKTCGCSATKLSKKIIPSGQSATLIADIKENSIAGPFSKNIYVESNAKNFRFLRLTLSGKAVPLVKVFPKKFLYLGVLTPGKSYSYSFKLKATQANVELRLMPSKANFPIQTSLKKLNTKEFLLTITATPKNLNNSLNAKIMIYIASPKGWPPINIKLIGKATSKTK
jgi:Protein of unknown function (DUF1573)